MEKLIVLLVCVPIPLVFTINESVLDTGVEQQRYPIDTNCSVSVPTSEVEQFHRVKDKATKLIYVHFDYNGTQWKVIKILEEKARYLLMLGDYERYIFLSLHTLSYGIEHTYITLYMVPQKCLTLPDEFILNSMMLVSNNFRELCKNSKCLENICIERHRFADMSVRLNDSWLCINMFKEDDVMGFRITSTIVEFMFLIYGFFKLQSLLKTTFIGKFCFPERTVYKCSSDYGISIIRNSIQDINKQCIPSGISSTIFDLVFTGNHAFEEELLRCSNQKCIKLVNMLLVNILVSTGVYLKLGSIFTFWHWLLCAFFLLLVTRRCAFYKKCYSKNYFQICIAFKRIYKCKWHCSTNVICIRRHLLKYTWNILTWMTIVALITSFLALFIALWLYICIIIVGITTNAIPYIPLVIAGFVYLFKISARLSNWYSSFFELILESVISLMEENTFEDMQLARENVYHIALSRLPIEIKGDHFRSNGIPLFIDEGGTVSLASTFYRKCIIFSLEHFEINPKHLLFKGILQIFCVAGFLSLIAIIIQVFGLPGGQLQSISHLSLVSVAGGIIPFLLDTYFIKDIPMSNSRTDKLLKAYIKRLMSSYEESFEIASSRDASKRTDVNELEEIHHRWSSLTSNESEHTTMQSYLLPGAQDLTTEESDSMTEHPTEGDDTSERSPLFSPTTNYDVRV